ncbi:MAG: hypothetical protein M1514_01515 [Patescibacteria group bacterium]|nr:hypothetical protein [Patescibacteria group bacterium]
MNKQLLKDGLGWGFLLWLVGYILGIVFFMLVPPSMIGFVVMPIGIVITLWVLFKKIGSKSFNHYLLLAITWTAVAVIFDYLFLVKAFKSTNYYKLDVYLYYLLTFVLPLLVGWRKSLGSNGSKLRT